MEKQSTLQYVLETIPEVRKSIISCLYPFEVVKLLKATGATLTARETSIYANPLYDVIRDPAVIRRFRRAGVRMVLTGSGVEVIKSRISNPTVFKSSYDIAELGVVMFLLTDGLTAPKPVYRFVYDEGRSSPTSHDHSGVAKSYMRYMNTSMSGAGKYNVYHTHYSRTSLMISPASHDVCTVVFVPDDNDLKSNVVVMRPDVVPRYYTETVEGSWLAWAEVVDSLSYPGSYEIGPVSYAPHAGRVGGGEDHVYPRRSLAESYKNITISACEEGVNCGAMVYEIPVRPQSL